MGSSVAWTWFPSRFIANVAMHLKVTTALEGSPSLMPAGASTAIRAARTGREGRSRPFRMALTYSGEMIAASASARAVRSFINVEQKSVKASDMGPP